MRVLIADADEQFLEIVRVYLQRYGHDVATASDGLECTATLRDFVPNILVLDGELLWADGVAEEIRKVRAFAGIEAVLISDTDPLESSAISSPLPVVGWLRKPFALADLLEQITTVSRQPVDTNCP